MIMKIVKIMGIFVLIFSILIVVTLIAFYRKDLTLDQLEDTYFTDQSHYITLEIETLEGEQVSIDIHYQDFGNSEDPVIVLLHGAFASSHTFIPWAESLVDVGYRVILIDLPYHGLSGGFDDHITSLRRSAWVVKSLLDFLDIEKVIIGGNSMGGGVSWYFTSLFHGLDGFEVTSLILIDAIHPDMTGGRPGNAFFDVISQDPFAQLISKLTPRFLLASILDGVYGSASSLQEETIDRYYDLLRREGNRLAILKNTQETIDTSTVITMLQSSGIRILVMWGTEDSWIPVDVALRFKNDLGLTDDRVILYEGLGHVPMEENPDLTFVDLLDFLSE